MTPQQIKWMAKTDETLGDLQRADLGTLVSKLEALRHERGSLKLKRAIRSKIRYFKRTVKS